MATKASGTLVLIIEKKHAPWGHMVSASPSLELRLWCRLRKASEWVRRGAGVDRTVSCRRGRVLRTAIAWRKVRRRKCSSLPVRRRSYDGLRMLQKTRGLTPTTPTTSWLFPLFLARNGL